MIGSFYKIEINITDIYKQAIYINNNSCLENNLFVGNSANLGGAAIRINGFNSKNILTENWHYLSNLIK